MNQKSIKTFIMENANQISTLHQLLDDNTRRFIAGEAELKINLHEWINQATSFKLKAVLQKYLDYVENNINAIEQFIEKEGINVLSNQNKSMHAMIEETQDKLRSCSDLEVKDACLLSCIQVINHYKISIYGTAAAYANALNMEASVKLFKSAEINEKQIDDRLTQMAEYEINKRAIAPIVLTVS